MRESGEDSACWRRRTLTFQPEAKKDSSSDMNPRVKFSRLVNTERQVNIALGKMYMEEGVLRRRRVTRCVADNSSFGNPGIVTLSNSRRRKREAGIHRVLSCNDSRTRKFEGEVFEGHEACSQ